MTVSKILCISGRDLFARDVAMLGFMIGVVMPLVSATLYPLYYHQMTYVWQEWTRLLELPFVACELIIIALAQHRGMNTRTYVHRIFELHPWACGLFFVGLFASSLLLSKMATISLLMSLITLVHLWFAMAVYFISSTASDRDWDLFASWLVIGLVPLALLTAWKFNFPPERSNGPNGEIEWFAALPGFISVRHFGSWTAAVGTAALARFLFAPENGGLRLWLSGFALAAMLTIWSGTRAGVLTLIVVPVAMAVAFRFRTVRRRIVAALAASVAAATVAWMLVPSVGDQFLLYNAGDGASANAVAGGRLELWQSTLSRWLDSPLIGWGTGSTFWEVTDIGWAHTQPHNFILQFLISWGLVGAIPATFLLVKGLAVLLREGLRHSALIPLLAVTLSMILLSLQEGMLHYPRFIMMSAVGFAAFLARSRASAGEDGQASPMVVRLT